MKTLLTLTILVVALMGHQAHAADPVMKLKEFQSDGCTGFIDGPPGDGKRWLHCCFEHDLRYWFGGLMDDRDFADVQLRECVREAAGSRWANIVYRGVRMGHSSPIKVKNQRWSWGWSPEREDVALTQDEKDFVEVELRQMPLEPEYVEKFISTYLRQNP